MDTFGTKLKQLRKKMNLTQQEMSEKIGVARSTYSLYESDKREPNIETLNMIKGAAGEELFYLLFMDNDVLVNLNFSSNERLSPDQIRSKLSGRDIDFQNYFVNNIRLAYELIDRLYKKEVDTLPEKDLIHIHYLVEFLAVYNDMLDYFLNQEQDLSKTGRMEYNLFLAKIQVLLWDFQEVVLGKRSIDEVIKHDLYLVKHVFDQVRQQKGL